MRLHIDVAVYWKIYIDQLRDRHRLDLWKRLIKRLHFLGESKQGFVISDDMDSSLLSSYPGQFALSVLPEEAWNRVR